MSIEIIRRWQTATTLLPLMLLPGPAWAQGLPTQNGPMLPLGVIWAGSILLGLVLVYGIMRNRKRTRSEKQMTEQATKNLYAETDRDDKRQERRVG